MCKRTQQAARNTLLTRRDFADACGKRNLSGKGIVLEAMKRAINPNTLLAEVVAYRGANNGQTPDYARR